MLTCKHYTGHADHADAWPALTRMYMHQHSLFDIDARQAEELCFVAVGDIESASAAISCK
jgi:hypothetical protein